MLFRMTCLGAVVVVCVLGLVVTTTAAEPAVDVKPNESVEVLSKVYRVDRLYRSMMGPRDHRA